MIADPQTRVIRILAIIAMCAYHRRGDRVPSWIVDLVSAGADGTGDYFLSNFRVYLRAKRAGLITWRGGWHLTEAGRARLDAEAPGIRQGRL